MRRARIACAIMVREQHSCSNFNPRGLRPLVPEPSPSMRVASHLHWMQLRAANGNHTPPMSARQKAWARKKRAQLVAILGGKCQVCATSRDLTFDCRKPRGADHHRMDSSMRISFYMHQARQGNLNLLCSLCNAIKSGMNAHDYEIARRHVHAVSASQSRSSIPLGELALTPADLRKAFAVACSMTRARSKNG